MGPDFPSKIATHPEATRLYNQLDSMFSQSNSLGSKFLKLIHLLSHFTGAYQQVNADVPD